MLKVWKKEELIGLAQKEVKFIKNKILTKTDHNNGNKQLKAVNLMLQMLKCSDIVSVTAEKAKAEINAQRGFEFFNLGTVAEQVLKATYLKSKRLQKSVSLKCDTQAKNLNGNNKRYEIKASLGFCSKNTTYQGNADLLLVNQKGVWEIDKATALSLCDSRGRFSPTLEAGIYRGDIASLLGF